MNKQDAIGAVIVGLLELEKAAAETGHQCLSELAASWAAVLTITATLTTDTEDTRRLDWLALHPRGAEIIIDGESRPCVFWGISSAPEHTLREVIDAALAGDTPCQTFSS